jgi:hypothetical protein
MQNRQLALLLSLAYSFGLPSQAVPSLLCIPKTTADYAAVTDNQKQNQPTARKIRVYYVNGHSEWEATVLVVHDQVKAIIFRGSQRPISRSKIDSLGFGSGVDFRGMPWEFHGFLDP